MKAQGALSTAGKLILLAVMLLLILGWTTGFFQNAYNNLTKIDNCESNSPDPDDQIGICVEPGTICSDQFPREIPNHKQCKAKYDGKSTCCHIEAFI